MSGQVSNLNEQEFKDVIHSNGKPILVDFWAPWCGPCRMIAPILNEVAEELGDRAQIAKVNVDEEPGLASQYGIQSIPNMVVFKDGKPVRQLVGYQDKKTIVGALS